MVAHACHKLRSSQLRLMRDAAQANVNKKAQKRADKAEAQREAQRQRDRLNSPQRLTKPQPVSHQ